nr:lysine-rich arabinogalactan protein 19-like [Aegilops tauschii subsp. strangulata]
MPSTSPPCAYNYVDRNPSPHLVQPLLDPPSPRSSSARFRARKLYGHHCLTLVTAATVLAVPQEHVQEAAAAARAVLDRTPAYASDRASQNPCSSCRRPLLLERAPAPFRAPPRLPRRLPLLACRRSPPPSPPTAPRLHHRAAAAASASPPPLRDRLPRGSASAPRCRAPHLAMPAATWLAAVLRPAGDRPCPAAIPCARAGFAPHTPATLPPVLAPGPLTQGPHAPFSKK